MRLVLITLLLVWFSNTASLSLADEGFFFKGPLPPQLRAAWDATFLVEYENGEKASAFVIDKQMVSARRVQLVFLTSDHLVQGNCQRAFGYCEKIKKITASEGINTKNDNPILMDQRDWTIQEVHVIDRHVDYDIALLGATADREKYRLLTPIFMVSDCRKLRIGQLSYLIGFPEVSSRTAPNAKLIDDPDEMVRRWSRGKIKERVFNKSHGEEDQEEFYWLAMTNDALPGNSGGPALTAQGEFYGVLHGIKVGAGKQKDQYPYLGDDPESNRHSYLTNCPAIKRFLGR